MGRFVMKSVTGIVGHHVLVTQGHGVRAMTVQGSTEEGWVVPLAGTAPGQPLGGRLHALTRLQEGRHLLGTFSNGRL